MRRPVMRLLALLLLAGGAAQATGIKLRPQGEALTRAVQAALAELSTREIPMTLDTSGGPTLTLGGVGVSAAPFNPDESGRVVQVGGERRIEINPQATGTLLAAVREALRAELKLKDWTPAAAQLRFGGADLNGDGVVDLSDLALLMDNYGKSSAYQGDLNQDGKVNDADVQIFMALYRTSFAYDDPLGPIPAEAAPAESTPAETAPTESAPAKTAPTKTAPTTPATAPGSPTTPNPATPDPANPAPASTPPAKP